jgi:hypothetical protein
MKARALSFCLQFMAPRVRAGNSRKRVGDEAVHKMSPPGASRWLSYFPRPRAPSTPPDPQQRNRPPRRREATAHARHIHRHIPHTPCTMCYRHIHTCYHFHNGISLSAGSTCITQKAKNKKRKLLLCATTAL